MKRMMLLKANPELSRTEFFERHQNVYAPLIASRLASDMTCRHHYITSKRSPALVAIGSPFKDVDFDVITEFDCSGRAGEATLRDRLASPEVKDAGARIFDEAATIAFTVEEAFTPEEGLAPRPTAHVGAPRVRTFILLKKRPSMSRRQFIDHYEGRHAALALEHLAQNGAPVFATYRRNYPVPQTSAEGDAADAPYDCLSEICYWDEQGAEGFARALSQEHVADIFDREQDIMLDREAVALIQVLTRPDGGL